MYVGSKLLLFCVRLLLLLDCDLVLHHLHVTQCLYSLPLYFW